MTGRPPTPRLSRSAAALLALVSLAAITAGAVWYAARAPAVPITELELAGTASRAAEIVGDRGTDFRRAVDADGGLILGYLAALVTAAELGRRVFWTARARAAARFAGIAAAVAAVADVIENLILRGALTAPASDTRWMWAQAAAFTKFGLLALAVPVALTAVAFTVGRLLIRAVRRPERFAEAELRPAPPLEPPAGGRLPHDPASAAGAARAAGRTTGAPGAASRWAAASALPPGRDPARVGICASGGGIRSACVTLGALQSLREAGELQRAGYLVSVSGGGYTAGAFQLALQPRTTPGGADPNAATAETVLRPGSAEEDHVRRHGRYIADSAKEWAVALGGLARGMVLSLALITLTVVVAGLAFGLFYRWVPVAGLAETRPALTTTSADAAFPAPETGVLVALALFAGAALALHVLVVVGLLWGSEHAGWLAFLGGTERVARQLGGLVGVLAVLGVGVPTLVWLAGEVLTLLGRLPGSNPVGGGVATLTLAYLGTLVGVLWRSRRVIGSGAGRIRGLLRGGRSAAGTASAVPTGLVQRAVVLLVLALLVVALLVVLGLVVGVTDTWSVGTQLAVVGAFAAAVLLLDQTWLSLHPFYRERLAGAFAVRRATGADGRAVAAPYDFNSELTSLSRYGRRVAGFPKVIFAAAANLGGDERTPPGRRAVSFTLADDWIGGPDVGWARTAALERRTAGQLRRDLTVQAAVAISGAAFASAMGRQARAYQTFFALSGARLGAWLPNPDFLYQIRGDDPDWRAPRLPRLRRLPYLFREVFGSYALDDRLLYCTDGGHYENLGLVELLRHRCRLVYCLDASGDSPPFATTLAEAIMLAYEELGVRVDLGEGAEDLVPGRGAALDPGDPLGPLAARMSKAGVVVGRIRYPEPVRWDGLPRPSRDGLLVVAKATLAEDLPYELKAYAAANPVFPRDSTSDQWFDHGQFDAYQGLGRHLGRCAAEAGRAAERGLDRPTTWWRKLPARSADRD